MSYATRDGRDWKPYVFRDSLGDLILRIAPIRLDVRLRLYADPAFARDKVGYQLP